MDPWYPLVTVWEDNTGSIWFIVTHFDRLADSSRLQPYYNGYINVVGIRFSTALAVISHCCI